ncbi:helix-turn-helix transcriptional regulator [Spirosoma oryzicola]|uniref:helix-turn-helix transcriptional regulator n=1 Tax=Spirosoma oryzicola TaxID=2898794 RepID=UPI001E3F6099|nr:AraC family transcriptional regulator [Spirosoma oryzicola]UHG94825.1 AraC family transcriptional regulator [Spirosoma oryzicola]
MEIMLKLNGSDILLYRGELLKQNRYKEFFREEQVISQHNQVGTITATQITTGSFMMAHCQLQLTHTVQLSKEVEEDVVELSFALKGSSRFQTIGQATRHAFSTGQHNICYFPRSKSVYEFLASDHPLDYSVVIIPKETYFRLLPADSDLHRQFALQLDKQKTTCSFQTNLPITPAIASVLRDMRGCQRTGSLKRLYLESKVTELLMLQLEQMQTREEAIPFFNKADYRKIHEARELLDAHYVAPPTIIELAKLVGLNEFKLKRGFKEQVGTTILSYITQRRMEDAHRWLLEGEKTIGEISYNIGYKSPAHFTAVFKRYYGLLPSAVLAKLT